ncbi:MAG: hypothetical protein AAF270_01695 [Pseudomonadota bacterium]
MSGSQPQSSEQIHALPVFLLVLGASSFGIGMWWLISEPVRLLPAMVAVVTSAILFAAAAICIRVIGAQQSHDGTENEI